MMNLTKEQVRVAKLLLRWLVQLGHAKQFARTEISAFLKKYSASKLLWAMEQTNCTSLENLKVILKYGNDNT